MWGKKTINSLHTNKHITTTAATTTVLRPLSNQVYYKLVVGRPNSTKNHDKSQRALESIKWNYTLYRTTCISRHPQDFVAGLLLPVTSAFRLGRRCQSSPQWGYLHHLCTITKLFLRKVHENEKDLSGRTAMKSSSSSIRSLRRLSLSPGDFRFCRSSENSWLMSTVSDLVMFSISLW